MYSGDIIKFPHRFDLGFVLRCVSAIEGLNLSRRSKMAALIALGLDQLRVSQKGSSLYSSVSSSEPAMRLVLIRS